MFAFRPGSLFASALYVLRLSVHKSRISSMVGIAAFTVALNALQVVFLLTGRNHAPLRTQK